MGAPPSVALLIALYEMSLRRLERCAGGADEGAQRMAAAARRDCADYAALIDAQMRPDDLDRSR